MRISKNALLLFCKPPVPGFVKTRLIKENGGPLSPEEAAEFFRCSILDMADLAMVGLDDLDELNAEERAEDQSAPRRTYDFFISTTPPEKLPLIQKCFEDEGGWDRSITYLCDAGASFDEHFDDAFDQLWDRGYDNVVAIGGDMPTLPREHVVNAFRLLDHLASESEHGWGFVQAPCQQAGTSIVGQTRLTPLRSNGIYYNEAGRPVLDGYMDFVREHHIPNAYLSAVADVDRDEDLAHTISCLEAIAEAERYQPGIYLARRVLAWIDGMGLRSVSPPSDEHDPRNLIDSRHEARIGT